MGFVSMWTNVHRMTSIDSLAKFPRVESERSTDTGNRPYIDGSVDRYQAQPRRDGDVERVELVGGKERRAIGRLARCVSHVAVAGP